MKITIKQSGGLSGMERTVASADYDQLSKALVDQISEHVDQLLALRERGAEPIGADQLRYEIEVSQQGIPSRKITVIDEGVPEHPAMKHVLKIVDLLGAADC